MKKTFRLSHFIFLISHFAFLISPAQLPDTDIWLLDVSDSAGVIKLSNPVNITSRKGYDNQPAFSPDGKYILFTSIRDSSQQSDIYKYDLKTKQTTQFTNTPTSEYSPTFMPGGKVISVVMVEEDSSQRLWRFPLKGGKHTCVLPNVDSVGYHCWLSKNEAGVFILTQPFTLQLAHIQSGVYPKILADSIGRTIKPGKSSRSMYYTEKTRDDKNQLCHFNYPGLHTRKLPLIIDGEDFTMYDLHKEQIVYSQGTKLFTAVVYDNNSKKEIADLSSLGIKNITRIAISPDGKRMAVVCTSN
ncbi:MAG: hypothetical protein AB1458_15140 [Bacteroidota bacterium]